MTSEKHLDFDQLRCLAETDPAAFERLRQALIDEAISRAAPDRRQHLRALQWRIDQARRRCRNPLTACVILSNMMWDSVVGKQGLLRALGCGKMPARAKVLPFEAKHGR